jgi:aminopeptidase N
MSTSQVIGMKRQASKARIWLANVVITGVMFGFSAASADPTRSLGHPIQLSADIRPSLYRIDLNPHAKDMRFDGHEIITIDIAKETHQIVLNGVDIQITSATIANVKQATKSLTLVASYDANAQTIILTASKPIAAGSYNLNLEFTGTIGTQAVGLFALDYDQNGQKQRALFTQFENSDARRMIPSFDEPAFKAKFILSATVDKDLMAVSNMPVQTAKMLDTHTRKITFQPTPIMSSYLLFFAVGDFERLSTHLGKTELGVVARKGSVKQAQYALEQSKTMLDEYQKYFNIPYPLPKLDNVAAPGQSQFFGAMENWGAIFTFEYALLVDPKLSTTADIRSIFSTEAHEVAHQWFGDLVTMNWWDDIWLNEGFASWMEERTTQKLHPEWHTEISKVAAREGAMSQDALTGTHPVVQHITSVEQASSAFDAITYQKGAAVIGMLEDYVGPETWRKGVSQYLRQHAYGNAESDELWKSIDKVSTKPITNIARAFTAQAGIPLVVIDSLVCRNEQTEVSFSQREFTSDRPDKPAAQWPVPVTAVIIGHEPVRGLIENGSGQMTLPGCGALVVNAGQNGYYRTLYSTAALTPVITNINQISAVDQLGLMADRWALGSVGMAPLTDYLTLIHAMSDDTNEKVVSRIAANLSQLDTYYSDGAARDRLRAYAIKKLSPQMAKLGFEPRANEPASATELRSQLFGVLSTMGDPSVTAEAKRRYEGSVKDPSLLPPALRKTILAIVAENADEGVWEQLHQAAKTETTPQIKDFLYGILGYAKNPQLAQKALNLALTDEPSETVRASIIRAVSGDHPRMAFEFAQAHREKIMSFVDNSARTRFLPSLISASSDLELAELLAADAQAHGASETREVKQALARIKLRAQFKSKQIPVVDKWLAQQ